MDSNDRSSAFSSYIGPEWGDRPHIKNLPPRLRRSQKKPQSKPEIVPDTETPEPPSKFILARRPLAEKKVEAAAVEEEETCLQAKSLQDEELLQDDADPSINIQDFIVSRLELSKDRLFMLQLEKDFLELINDPKRDYMAFPSLSSYHRLLVHRVAAYFGLEHLMDSVSQTILVSKCLNTRIPKMRFSEMTTVEKSREETASPKMILQRRSSEGGLSSSKETSPCPVATVASKSDDKKTAKKLKTIEEREAEYNEARARIFSQAEKTSEAGDSTGAVAAAATRKQPLADEIDDSDEYRRTPMPSQPKDNEYSRRLVNFKPQSSQPLQPSHPLPQQYYGSSLRFGPGFYPQRQAQPDYMPPPSTYANQGARLAAFLQQQRYPFYGSGGSGYRGMSHEQTAWLLQQQQQKQYENLFKLQQQHQMRPLHPFPLQSLPVVVFDIYDVIGGVSIENDIIPLLRQLGGDVRVREANVSGGRPGLIAVFGDANKAGFAFEYCQKQPHGKFKLRPSSPDVIDTFSRMNIS